VRGRKRKIKRRVEREVNVEEIEERQWHKGERERAEGGHRERVCETMKGGERKKKRSVHAFL
jgi:hypothetical protein